MHHKLSNRECIWRKTKFSLIIRIDTSRSQSQKCLSDGMLRRWGIYIQQSELQGQWCSSCCNKLRSEGSPFFNTCSFIHCRRRTALTDEGTSLFRMRGMFNPHTLSLEPTMQNFIKSKTQIHFFHKFQKITKLTMIVVDGLEPLFAKIP